MLRDTRYLRRVRETKAEDARQPNACGGEQIERFKNGLTLGRVADSARAAKRLRGGKLRAQRLDESDRVDQNRVLVELCVLHRRQQRLEFIEVPE